MIKKDVVNKICDYFDYNYKIYDDGRIVIDDGLGTDHEPTLEWLDKNLCGHIEYNSVNEMLIDWLEYLIYWEEKSGVFSEEIKFIESIR